MKSQVVLLREASKLSVIGGNPQRPMSRGRIKQELTCNAISGMCVVGVALFSSFILETVAQFCLRGYRIYSSKSIYAKIVPATTVLVIAETGHAVRIFERL